MLTQHRGHDTQEGYKKELRRNKVSTDPKPRVRQDHLKRLKMQTNWDMIKK